MSKEIGVVLLGFFVAIIPFLGFPSSWRTPILIVTGLLLVCIGFLLRSKSFARYERRGLPFAENGHSSHDYETPSTEEGSRSI